VLNTLGPVAETESIWPRQCLVDLHFKITSFGNSPHNFVAEYIDVNTFERYQNVTILP
jgi:hypothetical protein